MPGGPADPNQVKWTVVSGTAASYRSLSRHLASATAGALLALYAKLTDKQLTGSELISAGAVLIASANQRAASLADLHLAQQLQTAPLGLQSATADPLRLETALDTALSDTGNAPQISLPLVGESEPLHAGQLAMTDGMQKHGVRGWTRGASATACVYCASLADGSVLPPSVQMASHAGCSCTQMVVTD